MSLLNPMGLNGPNASPNVQQPDTVAHPVSTSVASYPVASNTLNLTWPLTPYVQPGTSH
jgi:hypothetical protein